MTFEAVPKTSSFIWVFPDDGKPLHKEIVMGQTPTGIQEVWYSVRECGWFDMKPERIKVVLWKKVMHPIQCSDLPTTRFFKVPK